MPLSLKSVAGALLATVIALVVVGFVSGTPLRHLIQILPALIAFGFVALREPWAAFGALPIFCFWLMIMSLIWLYLLGIANVVTGTFTPVEIVLTIAIGASSVWGILAALRVPRSAGRLERVLATTVFGSLQIGAMWLSLLQSVATR
jgi:hypothetical protein